MLLIQIIQLIVLLILATLVFSQSAESQSFKLKDGTVVVGTIQNETDIEIEVLTKFGLVKINKSSLIQTQYEVKLNSGETLIGTKVDNGNSIILNTSIGELTIQKSFGDFDLKKGQGDVGTYILHTLLKIYLSPKQLIYKQKFTKKLVITDTIDNSGKIKKAKNIEVLTISNLLAEAIKRISNSTSVSDLFK